jgi:uncharacterized phiE125 gp8 family phage protein
MIAAYGVPVLVQGPADLPLTLEEMRNYLRLDSDTEDPLLFDLITAATAYVDGYAGILGRALMTQTWEQRYSSFPTGAGHIPLVVGPVQSGSPDPTAVLYYDGDNVLQEVGTDVYFVQYTDAGAAVTLQTGELWPTDVYSRLDAVAVRYVVGYGSLPSAVPEDIRQALRMIVAAWFDTRAAGELPVGARWMLDKYLAPAF